MTTGAAEQWTREQLTIIYDNREAANIGNLVLEFCTGYSRIDRLMKKDKDLTSTQELQLHHLVNRLLQHEPVQYVLGQAWFFGMELYVDKNVLIPRPETEELVEWIVNDVKNSGKDVLNRKPMEADRTDALKILDVGTGSGCIALALKKAVPKAEVWGCDVSEEALVVARRNGSALDIRVDFQGVDFLDIEQQRTLPTVDIVVSNPPYIPASEMDQMDANVVHYEPHTALFVPNEDALIFYQALALFGKQRMYPSGKIYMEIHENLGNAVTELFKREGYNSIEMRKDMQGKNRMIKVSI